jgi:hypothetical protein
MNAAEHFDWAVGRAMEYVNAGDGRNAMASLVSDLGKHDETCQILPPLMPLFVGEVMLDGPVGARRFIEGLPRPVVASRDGMSDLYDCCPAAPTQPHTSDCGLSRPDDDFPPNAGSAS